MSKFINNLWLRRAGQSAEAYTESKDLAKPEKSENERRLKHRLSELRKAAALKWCEAPDQSNLQERS